MSTLIATIQIRRDTAANWTANNPILLAGEEGTETDTNQRKIGDGVTHWTGLTYLFVSNITATQAITASVTGTQVGATQLSAIYNFVDTVANANDSVKVLAATKNAYQYIQNNGANDLAVFPFLGDTFIGQAINTSITVNPGAMLTVVCAVNGTWRYF